MHVQLMFAAAAVSLVLVAAPEARAADESKLATAKGCTACHNVDKKVIGPAYKEVAKKYAGQKDAADKLATKIIKGGSGAWGVIPMPANPQVNEAEAKKLAAWILGS